MGAIPNSPLNSEGWGDESYGSCLDPGALNLINYSLRGQKLETWEQWITLFSIPWSKKHGQICMVSMTVEIPLHGQII